MAGSKYGRESQHAPESAELAAAWAEAVKLNEAEALPDEDGTQYVPLAAVRIVPSILPRDHITPEAVESYMVAFDALPAILLQQDTFTMIGGQHRQEAAKRLGRQVVKIIEVEAADSDLWQLAFEHNRSNGVQMTTRERTTAARHCLEAHPDWSDTRIAEWAMIDRHTIARWRHKEIPQNPAVGTDLAHVPSQTGTSNGTNGSAPERTGRDGRTINTGKIGKNGDPAHPTLGSEAASFTPVPKPSSAPQRTSFGTSGTGAVDGEDGVASAATALATAFELDPSAAFLALASEVLSRHPRAAADDVPDESVKGADEVAAQLGTWLQTYRMALQERLVAAARS